MRLYLLPLECSLAVLDGTEPIRRRSTIATSCALPQAAEGPDWWRRRSRRKATNPVNLVSSDPASELQSAGAQRLLEPVEMLVDAGTKLVGGVLIGALHKGVLHQAVAILHQAAG